MNTTVCPLLLLGHMANANVEGSEDFAADCRKDKCQWWEPNRKLCAVQLIAYGLENKGERLK